jgi:putative transposase
MQHRAGLIPAKLPHDARDRAAVFDAVAGEWINGATTSVVTDKPGSYGVARRALMPETIHSKERYANNRAERSHQPTRVRERGMRRFKSLFQAQRFVRVHAAVSNLFTLGRHLVVAGHYRALRQRAFASWDRAVAA